MRIVQIPMAEPTWESGVQVILKDVSLIPTEWRPVHILQAVQLYQLLNKIQQDAFSKP